MRRTAALCGAIAAVVLGTAPAATAEVSHAPITGSGSGWSANAVNQWVADVEPNGLQVVYTANGSAQGRKDFAYRTVDFAVSDIGYRGRDEVTGESDTSQGREFVYLPIVAGGTSFPYQVRVGGKLVRDLRLSGETIARIFTNQIVNWNDPRITKDNNGRVLPSLPIIPVLHSEGSGSTAQLTRYFDTVHPGIWRPYFGRSGFTEYYPRKGNAIAQNGSDGVMNFIASAAANGAIGWNEYSYALAKDYPVVKVLNTAGYFTLPTQYNVAVALTKAQINMDKNSPNYLLQNLDNVYLHPDRRAYPLSSYSYMIIPTSADEQNSKMTTAKRQTLADFLYFSICQGQKEMGPIGYSPLPVNLVQAGFDQVAKLKEADPNVDLTDRDVTTCRNPTFVAGQPTRNYLAEIAPQPAACDKVGAGPCGATVTTRAGGTSATTVSAGTTGTATGTTGSGTSTAGPGVTGPATAGGQATAGAGAAPVVDPETGQLVPGTGTATSGDTVGDVAAVPTELAAGAYAGTGPLAPLAALLLVTAVVAPPLLSRRLAAASPPRDQE